MANFAVIEGRADYSTYMTKTATIEMKQELDGRIGNLDDLETIGKKDLVTAINETYDHIDIRLGNVEALLGTI